MAVPGPWDSLALTFPKWPSRVRVCVCGGTHVFTHAHLHTHTRTPKRSVLAGVLEESPAQPEAPACLLFCWLSPLSPLLLLPSSLPLRLPRLQDFSSKPRDSHTSMCFRVKHGTFYAGRGPRSPPSPAVGPDAESPAPAPAPAKAPGRSQLERESPAA